LELAAVSHLNRFVNILLQFLI